MRETGIPESGSVSLDFARATAGKSRLDGFKFQDIPVGKRGTLDIVVPLKTGWDLLAGFSYDQNASPDDQFWVEVNPNFDVNGLFTSKGAPGIGLVGATAAEGSTTIKLSTGTGVLMRDNRLLDEGYCVRFKAAPADVDAAAYEGELYEIADFDAEADTITLVDPLRSGGSLALNDKVYITRRSAKGAYVFPGQVMVVGEYAPGSANVPQKVKIRMIYKNSGSAAIAPRFNVAYMRGRVINGGEEIEPQ